MRRRDFIKAIAATTAGWPLAARAQRMPTIGLLSTAPIDSVADRLSAFRQGLRDTGYAEGRNVTIEYRSAGGQREPLLELAADLVRRPVDVIVAIGSASSPHAAKAATSTIPIVFAVGADPISSGLVASLARPGGNITGVTLLAAELTAKRLELVRDLLPKAKSVAYLGNPANLSLKTNLRNLQEPARTLGFQMVPFMASTANHIVAAFAAMAQAQVDALLVQAEPLFTAESDRIIQLAARARLPGFYGNPELAKRGGLLSYAADTNDSLRQAGVYTGRILKGEKPAELPVLQPTKFELVLNLKTAQALELTISREFLLRADEVIE